jgi:hypothetical protein
MSVTTVIRKALAKAPEEECRTCVFFYFKEHARSDSGSCHRYPTDLPRPASYWCGEYKIDQDEANYEKK